MKHWPDVGPEDLFQIGKQRFRERGKARRTVIFHRDVHRPQYPVGNIRRSRDKQKISTWHGLPRIDSRLERGRSRRDGGLESYYESHRTRKPLLVEIYQAALAAVAPGPGARSRPAGRRIFQPFPPDSRLDHRARQGGAADGGSGGSRARRSRPGTRRRARRRSGRRPSAPSRRSPAVVGDHPEPGAGSLAAADALDRLVKQVSSGDAVWVLLSGGTTSLIGAPQPGIAAPRAQGALHAAASFGTRHQGDEPRAEAVHPVGRRPARAKPRPRARALLHRLGCDRRRPGRHRVRTLRARSVHGARGPRGARAGRDSGTGWRPRCSGTWTRSSAAAFRKRQSPATRSFASRGDQTDREQSSGARGGRQTRAELGLVPEIIETPLVGEAATAGARIAEQLGAGQSPRLVPRAA